MPTLRDDPALFLACPACAIRNELCTSQRSRRALRGAARKQIARAVASPNHPRQGTANSPRNESSCQCDSLCTTCDGIMLQEVSGGVVRVPNGPGLTEQELDYLTDLAMLYVVARVPDLAEVPVRVLTLAPCGRSLARLQASHGTRGAPPCRLTQLALAAKYRAATIRLESRELLITNFRNSEQERDLTEPANCEGSGVLGIFAERLVRVGHPNPLPIDPACDALGMDTSERDSCAGLSKCSLQLAVLVLFRSIQSSVSRSVPLGLAYPTASDWKLSERSESSEPYWTFPAVSQNSCPNGFFGLWRSWTKRYPR